MLTIIIVIFLLILKYYILLIVADSLEVSGIDRVVEVKKECDQGVEFEGNLCGDVSIVLEENILRVRLRDEIQWLRRDPPTFEEVGANLYF